MAQTNVNIRMDENLKKEFDWLCGELGLNMTTAFNLFARIVVRQHRIPFDIALDYSASNIETPKTLNESKRSNKNPSSGMTYTDTHQMVTSKPPARKAPPKLGCMRGRIHEAEDHDWFKPLDDFKEYM